MNNLLKHKSVPIFLLFLAVERKPELRELLNFGACGNNTLGVKIDTSHINFLKARLSLDRPV